MALANDGRVLFSGYSMYPALKPGDLLIVRNRFSLDPGAIYCYRVNAKSITHRLVSLSGDKALFQGDRFFTGEWVPINSIEARVVSLIRADQALEPPPRSAFHWFYKLFLGGFFRLRGAWKLRKANGP